MVSISEAHSMSFIVVLPLFFLWFPRFLGLVGSIGGGRLFRALHDLGGALVLLDIGQVGEVGGLKALGELGVVGREVLGFTLIPVHVKEFGMVLHTPPAPRLRLL